MGRGGYRVEGGRACVVPPEAVVVHLCGHRLEDNKARAMRVRPHGCDVTD